MIVACFAFGGMVLLQKISVCYEVIIYPGKRGDGMNHIKWISFLGVIILGNCTRTINHISHRIFDN